MCDLNDLAPDLAFWTGFYAEEREADPVKWASGKAYLDLNRTMTFRVGESDKTEEEKKDILKKRNGLRDNATTEIRNKLEELRQKTPEEFDDWHEETCGAIIGVYAWGKGRENESVLVKKEGRSRSGEAAALTVGQAQKWLNMTLKYLWLLQRLGLQKDAELAAVIQTHHARFHVPLDSYVLRYVGREAKLKRVPDFPADNGLTEAYRLEKLSGSEWSRIDDYGDYFTYQKSIRDDLQKKGMSPLEWELEHWRKALEYYG